MIRDVTHFQIVSVATVAFHHQNELSSLLSFVGDPTMLSATSPVPQSYDMEDPLTSQLMESALADTLNTITSDTLRSHLESTPVACSRVPETTAEIEEKESFEKEERVQEEEAGVEKEKAGQKGIQEEVVFEEEEGGAEAQIEEVSLSLLPRQTTHTIYFAYPGVSQHPQPPLTLELCC